MEFKHLIWCYSVWQKNYPKFIFEQVFTVRWFAKNCWCLWKCQVSLDLKSDYSEGILSNSVDSKSLLENLVRNNGECTGFLMWFSVFCMTCIFKPTKRSKYVYSLLLFNESQLPLIEYTKTINSTASLVVAISNIKKLHNAGGYYKIQGSCVL